VNRSTLFRAYKSGKMSATRTDTGQIEDKPRLVAARSLAEQGCSVARKLRGPGGGGSADLSLP
jgi:hypothetical protein